MTVVDFVVFIVDDDIRMCEALAELCSSRGVESVAFGSVDEYLAYSRPTVPRAWCWT